MPYALLLAAALATQEEVIRRTDPARAQYQEAVELCRSAEELIEKDPETAVARLTELLDRFGTLPRIECRLRIKVFADDPGAAYAFFPYQFRGRARLATAKGAADRIEAAVRDFERSVERGAAASKPLLQSARLDWWTSLRPLLAREGWEPGRAGAAAKAKGLLRDFAGDKQDRAVAEAEAWIAAQLEPVEAAVRALRRAEPADRSRAAKDAAWLLATEGVVGGPLAERFRAAADRASVVASYRGGFRLKISAGPWAEVTRFAREGKDLELPARETPLVVPGELEIGDYEVELAHPRLGRRTRRIAASELQEGKTYLLSGDLEEGTTTLRLLP